MTTITISDDAATSVTVAEDGIIGRYLPLRLSAVVSIADTTINLNTTSPLSVGMWIALSPYTTNCEIKEVTAISGNTITVSAMTNAHAVSVDVFWFPEAPLFNVKMFGAKGDDSTNELTAFNAALRDVPAGGTLYIPSGTYRLDWVIASKNDFVIRGESKTSTIIKAYTLATYAFRISTSNKWKLRDLTIDGRRSDSSTSRATRITTVSDVVIDRVLFTNTEERALDFEPQGHVPPTNLNVTVSNCEFLDCDRNCMYIGNTGQFWITNNLIHSADGDVAIDCGNVGGPGHIIGNTILASGSIGIYVERPVDDYVIADNLILGSDGNGITITNEYTPDVGDVRFSITGNQIEGVTGSSIGIRCELDDVIIASNIINGFGADQIQIDGDNILVAGNICKAALGGACVRVDSTASSVDVSNNRFQPPASTSSVIINGPDCNISYNRIIGGDYAVQVNSTSDNNYIIGNMIDGPNFGIQLNDSDGNYVRGNVYRNMASNNSIIETGASDSNVVWENRVKNKESILLLGASSTSRDNIGSPSSASGVTTLTNGTTSKTVSFSSQMKLAPSLQHISVTPNEPLGAATEFYVDNVTATTFDINVDVDPGADIDFSWMIDIKP